ncbi:hypothetical protein ACFYNO_16990 [Kitasatospora sp. NPDC006697]|uniref:hypothetical protein n=1 Tax=Kitasatospora sp. NPDC006697 TaxID=3364020 RepID=UPI0036904BDC
MPKLLPPLGEAGRLDHPPAALVGRVGEELHRLGVLRLVGAELDPVADPHGGGAVGGDPRVQARVAGGGRGHAAIRPPGRLTAQRHFPAARQEGRRAAAGVPVRDRPPAVRANSTGGLLGWEAVGPGTTQA